MNDKLVLYDAMRTVPQEAQKTIAGGRLFGKTDINPMWRIKALTECFGACGLGWRYTIDRQWLETGAGDEISAFCNVSLYIFLDGDEKGGLMGIPVLILGRSGSGKSASLRNFSPDEVGVLNVASKPLPFRGQLKVVNHATYATITRALSAPKLKTYVVDDSQYLMAFEELDRAKEIGYQKFTDMALNFSGMIRFISDKTPDDLIVYFLHHTETTDSGEVKAKTVGKMIDSKLTLEGLFSIVLFCQTDGKRHWFVTQSDGYTTAKSPMEMFNLEIDNDLKLVDTTIRKYYKENWNLNGEKQ